MRQHLVVIFIVILSGLVWSVLCVKTKLSELKSQGKSR